MNLIRERELRGEARRSPLQEEKTFSVTSRARESGDDVRKEGDQSAVGGLAECASTRQRYYFWSQQRIYKL